jgi:hypothetical protein
MLDTSDESEFEFDNVIIPANPPVGILPHKLWNSGNLPHTGPLPRGSIEFPTFGYSNPNDPHSYFSGFVITVNRSKQTMGDHLKTLASSFHVRFISNWKSFLPCQLQQERGLCLDSGSVKKKKYNCRSDEGFTTKFTRQWIFILHIMFS